MREVDAVFIKLHAATAQPVTLGDAEINKIGRVFDEHDVAGIAQRLGGDVEQLLRAVRDDGAGGRVDAGVAQAVGLLDMGGGEFAQQRIAHGAAVLQSRAALARRSENTFEQFTRGLERQGGVVGEAGGERDEFGVLERELHQPRDGRLGRATGQLRKRGFFHASGFSRKGSKAQSCFARSAVARCAAPLDDQSRRTR